MKTIEKNSTHYLGSSVLKDTLQCMMQPVFEYCNNIYPMPDKLVADINELVKVKTYKKGDILLEPGKIADYACFIVKGLVKSYYVPENDISEVITKFYSKNLSLLLFLVFTVAGLAMNILLPWKIQLLSVIIMMICKSY